MNLRRVLSKDRATDSECRSYTSPLHPMRLFLVASVIAGEHRLVAAHVHRPWPEALAHSNTRYKERRSVRSTSNGQVAQVPALGRALINTPLNFWACRPTNGFEQIIRVPSVRPSMSMRLGRRPFESKFASVQDGNSPPDRIACPRSTALVLANGEYEY